MSAAALPVHVAADPAAAAAAAAEALAGWIAEAVAARGGCTLALSGGQTPWQMLEALASKPVAWDALEVFQVDERAVAFDDERRNARRIRDLLCREGGLAPSRLHCMPVTDEPLEAAAARHARTLVQHAGAPPKLDIAQLGLGPDGHTASLVPGDPLLAVNDAEVGISAPYQGTRRMSLTYPALNRARRILWLVTGAGKAEMLARLVTGDPSIPAGRVARAGAVVFADAEAAARLPQRAGARA